MSHVIKDVIFIVDFLQFKKGEKYKAHFYSHRLDVEDELNNLSEFSYSSRMGTCLPYSDYFEILTDYRDKQLERICEI